MIGRLLVTLALVAVPSVASAHALAPIYLRVALGDDGAHRVTLKHARVAPPPTLRTPCAISDASRRDDGELVVSDATWSCPPDARLVFVTEPGRPPLLVELADADGAGRMIVLDASAPALALTLEGTGDLATWSRWVALGMEHLALGLDHVLVILAFVALLGLRRRLVWALTAFTLGHSLSLALAATGLVSLPQVAVEIAIALTLVLLGLELAAPAGDAAAVARRSTRGVMAGAVAIGLVHGLGFAGVLGELVAARGTGAIAPALVGFNLGLELAQLAFVLALAAVAFAARRVPVRWPVSALTGWLVGVAGAAWVVDRAWP